jgi:outer membrane protein TolC
MAFAFRRLLILVPLATLSAHGQQAPPTPDKAWPVSLTAGARGVIPQSPGARLSLDLNHVYTLPELVDVAEENNPETHALWERAKQKAAAAGIAHSALFPTLAAVASASVNQYSLFFGKFYHENTALFPAIVTLSYTVWDFGSRRARIDQAQANLFAADFSFNDTHRKIIFRVTEAYYRLQDAMGQEDAAASTLKDAQTVQGAVEARLANGLATLPDVLEARATTAQARYELASIQGLETIARGSLATVLGASPKGVFHVEDVSNAAMPTSLEEPIETVLARAAAQRPDLLAQVALFQSADAEIKKVRSAFYPEISFSGDWGHSNAFGQQKNFGSSAQSAIYPYQAQVKITWNIFDGGARRNALASAQAGRNEAQAQAAESRDQIENEVWTAYTNLKTAQQQQESAAALLEAAQQSYDAATEAFRLGVRTFIDVTTAQRGLARARTMRATARVQLLSSFADFAFRAGDPIQAAQHSSETHGTTEGRGNDICSERGGNSLLCH